MAAVPFPKKDFAGQPIKDPMDTLVIMLAGVIIVGSFATFAGYGLITAAFLTFSVGLAYLRAPARKFPTAESIMKVLHCSLLSMRMLAGARQNFEVFTLVPFCRLRLAGE